MASRDQVELSAERRRFAGWAWMVAGLGVLIGEAIAAAAFKPRYSYAANYFSDLGVPVCDVVVAGRPICSPLHIAMSLGLGTHAALLLVGFVIALGAAPRRVARLILVLAGLQAIGAALVLLFPGPPPAVPDGSPLYHVLGAVAAIVCGNLVILAWAWPGVPEVPGWLWLARRVLPIIGLLAIGGLLRAQVTHDFPFGEGTWERISIYTIFGWEIAAGAWLLRSTSGVPTRPAV